MTGAARSSCGGVADLGGLLLPLARWGTESRLDVHGHHGHGLVPADVQAFRWHAHCRRSCCGIGGDCGTPAVGLLVGVCL